MNTERRFLSVKGLAKSRSDLTETAIRGLIARADPVETTSVEEVKAGNGLAPHIKRINRKILIDVDGFISWIDGQGGAK